MRSEKEKNMESRTYDIVDGVERLKEAIARVRRKVARFISAPNVNEIVFTRNASESLNILASQLGDMLLKPGDEVCISIMEHHSNLIPWQQVCRRTGAKLVYLRPGDDCKISPEEMARIRKALPDVAIVF